MLFRFQVLFCKYMQRLNIYSICVVFLDLKQNKCVLFLYVIFSFLLNVYSFQFFLNLKHKHIFKIYKVPVRCQTEIGVRARPFCNFCEVSNIKVRFDYINNTKRGKTTLGTLNSMGPGLSLEFINQKKNGNVSHSNVNSFVYSFKPLLLYYYYRSYPHTVTVVH